MYLHEFGMGGISFCFKVQVKVDDERVRESGERSVKRSLLKDMKHIRLKSKGLTMEV